VTARAAIAAPTTPAAIAAADEDLAGQARAEVVVAGPHDAPAIVFVHGTRLTKTFWSAQHAGLATEFRTVAFDLPAHGSRADEPFTLERAADALAATIGEHAGGRAVVVGLSLGGYVAMALAAREPELVRGLVISGSSAEPMGALTMPILGLAAMMDRFDDDRLDRLNALFFRWRYPPAIAEPIVAGGFWSRGGASALRTLVVERFKPRLAAYPGRTLIVNGSLDFVFRPPSRGFAAVARDAHRVRLGGASHLANLDRPAAFNEAVRRFARPLGTG
jgi:pimeloyl-ACP methyl ester carboxylesterase